MNRKPAVLAKLSLWVAGMGLLISYPFRHSFFGGLCLSGFEAGLVGGLADWFAVTALFRHPLGLRWIPHTGIIPANKTNLILAIEDVVQNEWLSLAALQAKIREISPLEFLTRLWTNKPVYKKMVMDGLTSLAHYLLSSLDTHRMAEILEQALIKQAFRVPLAIWLAQLFEWMIRHGYDEKIADRMLEEISLLVESPKFAEHVRPFLQKIGESYADVGHPLMRFGLWALDRMEVLNYEEMTESIRSKLLLELDQIRLNPVHPLRLRLLQLLPHWMEKLQQDEQMRAQVEEWKTAFLDRLDLTASLEQFLAETKEAFLSIQESGRTSQMADYLISFAESKVNNQLLCDPEKRAAVDNWIREQLMSFIGEHHAFFGKLVRENLEKLDDIEFVKNIEVRVGDDLQWIRINGAVVGTLVGLLLYLFTQLLERILFAAGGWIPFFK